MKILTFNCTFLSDVILNASSATAGTKDSLEYIPGAKFLGIVAKAIYNNKLSDEATLNIFHNGKVSFGDAHLVYNKERSLKIPFNFLEKKKKQIQSYEDFWIHHLLEDSERQKLLGEGTQLKSRQTGYFLPKEKRIISTKMSYALKAAYDADKRRSKDRSMYGYKAHEKGSVWQFKVELNEETVVYADLISESLLGEHGLGKSRSAQYGRVKIEKIAEDEKVVETTSVGETVVVYAASNLCFIDKNTGQYTVNPLAMQLGFEGEAKVDWSRSKIQHRLYAPWNVKRSSRDADRWIVEKGAVFIINNVRIVNWEKIQKGIGIFRGEGYGEILINPSFLTEEKVSLQKNIAPSKSSQETVKTVELSGSDLWIKQLLDSIQNKRLPQDTIADDVTRFIRKQIAKFEKISSSQWGQIRNIAQNVPDSETLETLLFNETVGFLRTAKRKGVWHNKFRILQKEIERHENFKNQQTFLIALASEMQKKISSNGN